MSLSGPNVSHVMPWKFNKTKYNVLSSAYRSLRIFFLLLEYTHMQVVSTLSCLCYRNNMFYIFIATSVYIVLWLVWHVCVDYTGAM